MPREGSYRTSTGIALHSSVVALTPARALTSHLRKRYHQKYVGRFRFARLIFTIDLVLILIVGGLLIANITFWTSPFFSMPAGFDLALRTDPITASAVTPVEATVRVTDGKIHDDVRLVWHLPSDIDVIRAEPPMARDGTIVLGTISPAQSASSRLYVRVRALPGSDIPFRFSVHEGFGLHEATFIGSDTRRVERSALTITPAIPAEAVEPGGTVPLIITNASSLETQSVIVRVTAKDGAPRSVFGDADTLVVGDMLPGEKRPVFLQIDPTATGTVRFVFRVQDASRAVDTEELRLQIVPPVDFALDSSLQSTPGLESTNISYHASTSGGIWISHPLQQTANSSTDRVYDVAPGNGKIHIPLELSRRTKDTTWSAIPFEYRNGSIVLGKRHVGVLSKTFPFQSEVRYYSATGDQLGVGPLPPRVGEYTTYWVVWSIGPTDADLKDVQLFATLSSHVAATGKFASSVPGTFLASDDAISWTVPSLPAVLDVPVTFAFEIRYQPVSSDRNRVPLLIEESNATAVEVRSGSILRAKADAQDANLEFDMQARGKGQVE